jgi:hypothetical protein
VRTAFLVFWLSLVGVGPLSAHGQYRISFGVFHESLRPHNVGRWAWTSGGWYWISDEPWGWATYHYGTWYLDPVYGWVWIPDYEWAPAWVEWRYGGDYIGWAPLGPPSFFFVNIGFHHPGHHGVPDSYWSFVSCHNFAAGDVRHHVYQARENHRYIGETRYIGSSVRGNERGMTAGPDRRLVEKRVAQRVPAERTEDLVEREHITANPRMSAAVQERTNVDVNPKTSEMRLTLPEIQRNRSEVRKSENDRVSGELKRKGKPRR